MIRRNFTNPGGLPFDQNILKSIDDGILNDGVFEILRSLQFGNQYLAIKLSGLSISRAAIPGGAAGSRYTVTAGQFFFANNIYSFAGGYVDILTSSGEVPALQIARTSSNLTYNSGTSQPFYTDCTATITSGALVNPTTAAVGTKIPMANILSMIDRLGVTRDKTWYSCTLDDGDTGFSIGGSLKVRENLLTNSLEFDFGNLSIEFDPAYWVDPFGWQTNLRVVAKLPKTIAGVSLSGNNAFYGKVTLSGDSTLPNIPKITYFGTSIPVNTIGFAAYPTPPGNVSLFIPKITQTSLRFMSEVVSVSLG